ncbi:hypothetical protein CARUB_v10016384mg [Capsella rubella]|uniref:Uncharacterized protein n=1 Tax=Capsella rubella TaxID=81985 RepID=R0GBT5_9BRAS|nr:uncharacterized protein LOC17891048 [Capsella rubella]EOA33051.1 hypothetical protein CARUB_v10016384mg [Capsella rubella]
MEATKERMEKEQKKRDVTSEAAGKSEENTTVRAIIRESVVEGRGGDDAKDGGSGTRKPEDILAFSRTVRKIDSSLE